MELSNIDMVLLEILCETDSLSWYKLNKIIQEREYQRQANIGKSSVYSRLSKLVTDWLIIESKDQKTAGQWPKSKSYSVTTNWLKAIKRIIV